MANAELKRFCDLIAEIVQLELGTLAIHFILMFATLITFAHFSASDVM